jgi:hypothetical protein
VLHGDSVAVDGTVSAEGGGGGGGGVAGDGGGGGGGRVSLEYRTLLDVTGTVSVAGGLSGSVGLASGAKSVDAAGAAGVVWELAATSPSIGASTTVNSGAALSATTVLKDLTTGAAVSGATVQLYRRTSPAGAWALLATRTTSGTGAASAPVPTTANADYQWRFGGSSTRQASSSAVQTVTARFVVNLSAKATTVVHGHSVTLYGTVKPVSLGQTVTLQRLVGTTWTNTLTTKLKVQTLPNGVAAIGYVFTRAQPAAGTFRYRVVKAGAATLAAGTSAVVTVKVT